MKKKDIKKKKLSLKEQLKKMDQAVELLNKEIEELKERNIKLLAEFDNFQRRTYEEKTEMKKYDGMILIKKLIPIFDDLNRAVVYDNLNNMDSMVEAIKMINSKLINSLNQESITSFDSIDETFDPMFHEALLEQNSDTVDKGKIIEEYEKGYKYHTKVIKHAKVVVSKGPEK